MASLARSSSCSSGLASASASSSSHLARRASTLHRPPGSGGHHATPPSSPPHSPSRVKMTIHAPYNSPSSSRHAGPSSYHQPQLQRKAPLPAPSSSSPSRGHSRNGSSSSSSNNEQSRRRRFDPHHPPRSGWEGYMYPISLGTGLGFGMTLFSLLRDKVRMEDDQAGEANRKKGARKGTSPQFGLDEVTLICFVGVPGAGKSSQATRMPERFKGFKVLEDVQSVEDLSKRVQEARKASKDGQETLLVVDGFPRTSSEAQAIESKLCPIFVTLFFDLPRKDFTKRFPKRSAEKEFDPAAKEVEEVVRAFRKRGNILEISADWESKDEVWEQVEAKVEQVLELKAMGEDVSVEE